MNENNWSVLIYVNCRCMQSHRDVINCFFNRFVEPHHHSVEFREKINYSVFDLNLGFGLFNLPDLFDSCLVYYEDENVDFYVDVHFHHFE